MQHKSPSGRDVTKQATIDVNSIVTGRNYDCLHKSLQIYEKKYWDVGPPEPTGCSSALFLESSILCDKRS